VRTFVEMIINTFSQQPPMDHGTADISIVMTGVLRKEEIENMKSDPTEYGQ
jgi:hypothetical protein